MSLKPRKLKIHIMFDMNSGLITEPLDQLQVFNQTLALI